MKRYYILILILLSGITHFIYFGYPRNVVFDEVHFGNFASAYTAGNYFFDIHPPLGKLLISAAGYIGGYPAESTNYGQIGNVFGDPRYMWYRILPMLAGFALPLVIFFLCLELGLSPRFSFLAGLLIIFENSLLVQSRFILLDSLLLLFGFSSCLLYAYSLRSTSNRKRLWLILAAALLATLSYSVKWTGISFLAVILVVELFRVIKAVSWREELRVSLKKAAIFFGVGIIIYFLIFAIHFALLPKSGPGDAFMSIGFQKTLIGSNYQNSANAKPLNLVQKFLELNVEMYKANSTLTATHQYGSKWWQWPLMMRPVYYWDNSSLDGGPASAMIYLLGNPFVYWLAFAAVVALIIKNFFDRNKKELLMIFAYLLNLLPFIFISRVAFLYHYETALVIAIITLAYLIDHYFKGKTKQITFYSLIVICLAGFLYFSPLTYGFPMNSKALMTRFWFSSWR